MELCYVVKSNLIGRRVCLMLVVYNCINNLLPEDEISGLKYVEDIKNKKLIY